MKRKLLLGSFLITFLASVSFALDPKASYADFEGNKIYYLDTGGAKKDAIVFIHGWTCNSDFWKDSISAFPGERVVALDLVGHGRSDKPNANYSMEYFARSVAAVMANAKIERAVLVGHSMGTPIARQFYRLYPRKTLGIVIVDGALKTFFPKAVMDQIAGQLRSNYKENGAKFVDGMLAAVKDEALRKFIRDRMLVTPDFVAISAWEAMADDKVWIDDRIDVPVLAVMAPSPFWPPNAKDIFSSIAPNIDFQMWTGVSHFLHMEKPKEFNDAVRVFLMKNKLL